MPGRFVTIVGMNSRRSLRRVTERMPKWAERLIREVLERDEKVCILCGAPVWNVHHIVPRGRKSPFSREVWRKENMACICEPHHDNTRETRVRCVDRMVELHGYDMSWVREHMIWEGGHD